MKNEVVPDPDDSSEVIEHNGHTLTLRQQRFVHAYCKHGNATRAAREADYSGDDASLAVTGSRLLRNVKVRAYLCAYQTPDIAAIDVPWIARRLQSEAIDPENADGTRVRALENLAKFRGMLRDNLNVSVADGMSDESLAERISKGDEALRQAILRRLRGE